MSKKPAFLFYPGDWLRDGVSGCSLAAQGLWLRMMIVMHDSPKYGYLTHNGDPMPDRQVAIRCGCTVDEYLVLLDELKSAYVPRFDNGVIYSKRMVEDEKERKYNNEKQRRYKQLHKGNRPVTEKLPHSSSSSSISLKKIPKKSVCFFVLPDWFPKDTWTLFLDHRKKVKAPITDLAYPSFVAKFEKLNAAGWPPGRVVEVMVEKGWRWFKPEWVEGRQQQPAAPVEFPMSRQKASDILKRWKEED